MWKVSEVPLGRLAPLLNVIEQEGASDIKIIDGSGSRKDYVTVAWCVPSPSSPASKGKK